MRPTVLFASSIACLAMALPAWAGHDKDKGHGHGHKHSVETAVVTPATVIVSDHDRILVRDWYHSAYLSGGCPPGLSRNGAGCLPPGQARKAWALGQPLGPSVVFDPLPSALIAQLSPLPDKYAYVRVGGDVLVVTVGTHIVQQPVLDLSDLSDPEQSRPLVGDADRDAIRNYYRSEYQNGNCPAGLTRTDDGCAWAGDPDRAWAIGQALPPRYRLRDVA